MAKYFIRVELRDAHSYDDYENLHTKMETRGYHRQIHLSHNLSSLGPGLADVARKLRGQSLYPVTRYKLPNAVYLLESDLPIKSIVEDVKNIASEIKTDPMVVVVNYSEIDFCNLTKV